MFVTTFAYEGIVFTVRLLAHLAVLLIRVGETCLTGKSVVSGELPVWLQLI